MTATPADAARGAPGPFAPISVVPFLAVATMLLAVTLASMAVPEVNMRWFVATQAVTRGLPDAFWAMVTICGTGLVALALLSTSLPWRPGWYAAALPAAALAGLYSSGLKHLYALPRPPSVLDAAHLHVVGHTLRTNSFPSGHAVAAFTLATLLTFASRAPLRTAAWTMPLAALVAISRIAVGAHWPADLAAGALGGWLCGAIGVVLADRWRRWDTPTGVRLMGLVSIGIGSSLFVVDLGYPQAIVLQIAMGVIAIACGLVTVARPRSAASSVRG